MYEIMCVIWQLVASIFGVIMLISLLAYLVEKFKEAKHDDD